MAYDYETQEFDDELDSAFIARYATGRLTMPTVDPLSNDEDDELDDLWDQSEQEEILETDSPLQEMSENDKKEQRRLYQKRWRAGEIMPVKAKSFTRINNGERENRRKLAYYLPLSIKEMVMDTANKKGINRRDLCINAISEFLQNPKEIQNNIINEPKIFVFDEVPSELWETLREYCKSTPKRIFVYQVVQQALLETLNEEKNG